MLFLFADESGDTNFKKGTRHFVYVGIVTRSKKECEKALQDLKEDYNEKFHRAFLKKELRANRLDEDEIIYFLDGLKDLKYEIFCVSLDTYDLKREVNHLPQDGLKRAQLLELVISSVYSVKGSLDKIVIDKGISSPLREQVKERLESKYKEVPKIEEEASHKVAGVQIADLVAWAIRKHLSGDEKYYSSIENKISVKTEL